MSKKSKVKAASTKLRSFKQEEDMTEIDKEISAIRSGTHSALKSAYEDLAQSRADKLKRAHAALLRKVEIAETEFAAEKKMCDDEYLAARKETQEKMIESLYRRRRNMQAERSGRPVRGDMEDKEITTRGKTKLRSAAMMRKAASLKSFKYALTWDEIQYDLALMKRALNQ